jgi:hypothetical protein
MTSPGAPLGWLQDAARAALEPLARDRKISSLDYLELRTEGSPATPGDPISENRG